MQYKPLRLDELPVLVGTWAISVAAVLNVCSIVASVSGGEPGCAKKIARVVPAMRRRTNRGLNCNTPDCRRRMCSGNSRSSSAIRAL